MRPIDMWWLGLMEHVKGHITNLLHKHSMRGIVSWEMVNSFQELILVNIRTRSNKGVNKIFSQTLTRCQRSDINTGFVVKELVVLANLKACTRTYVPSPLSYLVKKINIQPRRHRRDLLPKPTLLSHHPPKSKPLGKKTRKPMNNKSTVWLHNSKTGVSWMPKANKLIKMEGRPKGTNEIEKRLWLPFDRD